MAIIRSDGWVKAVTGSAVSGAQVYVCSQPANTAFLPPTPLASIFSDSAGLIPITQPVLTDGFGHYDFYVQAGTYTVVVGLGGVIQQVYPDQNVGGAAGVTYTAGVGISIVGSVISSTAAVTSVGLSMPAEFSVANSPVTGSDTLTVTKATQAANLVYAGPSSGGAAQPTFRALVASDVPSQVPTLGASNPFWWMLYDGSNYSFSNSGNGTYGTGTGDQIKFTMIRVPYPITLTHATTRILTTSAGGIVSCGIYTTGGSLLAAWDGISTTSGTTVTVAKTGGGSVTLQPGIYIAAVGCSNTSGAASLGGFQAGASNEGVEPWNTNGTTRTGTAANALGSGGAAAHAMPPTLGALSAGGSGFTTLPNILLEP